MSPRTEPNRVSRRHVLAGLGALAAIGSLPSRGAVPERSDRPLLFTNIRLFDGTTPRLRDGLEVLIHAGRITAVEAGMGAIEHAQVIDGGGRVLMPGLIDAHYHAMFAALPADRLQSEGLDYLALVAAQETEAALMRGYTSVRDMAGASFGLKRAIDENRMAGPRIYPSGLALSQTGGHGERRSPAAVPSEADVPHLTAEQCCSVIADGVDEVRRATREQFYKGASQIKIMAGGGIVSLRDPLEATQYSEEEMRAAVSAATDWGTYVSAHAYTSASIQRAIRAGVRCIEHGHLADDETVRMMRDKDVWWSLQPFVPTNDQGDLTDARQKQKLQLVLQGTDRAYALAKKYGINTAYGTDYAFNPVGARLQNGRLAALLRWRSPYECLRMATSENGRLLAMAGARGSYDGALGVVIPGACADLLLVDGNPLDDVESFVDPARTLRLIMKDGRVFKDTR